ncbi:ricin-type beta-trefoil lectin domain protein [Streptomyces sp. NPDC002764]|uniref:ricin-type beta-trefoil lectin domain protein n=1 Tax=Streptomyces sp. NPDC002764 TaxID=3154428 RepID=UPI00332D159E
MVSGYPTDAAENAVQANVTSVGYSGETGVPNGPQGTITGPGGKCVGVAADTGTNGAAVQLWDCQPYAEDQHWTHNPDNSLSTLGRCLDIVGNGTANATKVELWDCNGPQIWDCNGATAQKFSLS